MMKHTLLTLIIVSFFSVLTAQAFDEEPVAGTLIVKLKPENRYILDRDPAAVWVQVWKDLYPEIEIYRKFPGKRPPVQRVDAHGNLLVDLSLVYQVSFNESRDLRQVQEILARSAYFEYVELIYPVQVFAQYIPSDPEIDKQYHLHNINAFRAWGLYQGDTSTVLGVSDTGTDMDHPDLMGRIAYNYNDPIDGVDNDNDGFVDNYYGWDLGEWDNNPDVNKNGHGAHVSGIMSAETDNSTGVAGLGFKCRYLPVKADDEDGKFIMGYESLVYAADQGCAVINCSWGGLSGAGRYGQDIINYATYNKDALVVAACGNSNNDNEYFPASYENVISVAATDRKNLKWSGSTYNYFVDLCAPGAKVYSTWAYGNYVYSNGTSMAAPMVTATAGLVRSKYPNLNALQAGEQVRVNTYRGIYDNLLTAQYKDKLGTGLLDMYAAITKTSNPSVRFKDYRFEKQSFASAVYDTFLLKGTFVNYLSSTPLASKAVLRCDHPAVVVLDSVVSIPAMQEMGSKDISGDPFRIIVLPNMPLSERVYFKISYQLGSRNDFQYISESFNRGYFTLNTGNFKMTVNSAGKFGYNDDLYKQGIGLVHDNLNESMLGTGGLLVGITASKISDAVYGANGFDHDYSVQSVISKENPTQTFYERQFSSVFNDNAAGMLKTGLHFKQNILDWTSPQDDDYIIAEYVITNPTSSDISNIYAACYMDWNIHFSHKNRAEWKSSKSLAYVYDTEGHGVGGLMIMNAAAPVFHYAFENDGDDNSIEINDGFTGYEKWIAMRNNRPQAGFISPDGNDVSHMVSSGPYSLTPGDSLVVAFAIIAGNNLFEVEQAADRARNLYLNVAGIDNINGKSSVDVFPNPADGAFRVELPYSDLWKYEVFTSEGKLVDTGDIQGNHLNYGNAGLEAGVYLLRIRNNSGALYGKIIIR